MGNMIVASVSVQGTRPMLWHAFGPDSMPLTKQERTGVAGNDPEEWRKSVLMTADRQLYIKPTYVFGAIREGGRYIARKRGTLLPIISGVLQVMDDVIMVDRWVPEEPVPTDSTQPVYLDITGVRNPATKARNVRYRIAAAKGWQLTFNILWDKIIVSREEMKLAIEYAGQLVGLGDGRGIGNGRFAVTDLTVIDA
jgi:hypothetical protein